MQASIIKQRADTIREQFHRDFLNPLCPIYAREFLEISPIAMTRQDLEVSDIVLHVLFSLEFDSIYTMRI